MSDFLHEEEAIGKAYDLRLLQRLWRYVLPYRWQVAGTLSLVAPLFVMELAPAWVIKTAIERATGTPAEGATAWISRAIEAPAEVNPYLWFGGIREPTPEISPTSWPRSPSRSTTPSIWTVSVASQCCGAPSTWADRSTVTPVGTVIAVK